MLVSGAIAALSLAIAVLVLSTSRNGKTLFGIPLGADFAGFYVASQILERQQPDHLYDRMLHHRLYHDLLPNEDQNASIPYVHPPFVAGLLRPLTWLPYPAAVGCWLMISALLYLVGIWINLHALEWRSQRSLILLLAISFEPFAFECWLGGQLSAIGFFSFAACFAAMQSRRPVVAGLALGLCFYKPTLLILALPLLLVGRCWRMLLGMTITGMLLAGLSVMFVGWANSFGYLQELLAFNKSTSGGDLEIRIWKYVDLNNCLRLLVGSDSPLRLPLLAILSAGPFACLAWGWWLSPQRGETFNRLLWAATLMWIPLLNLYVGIYDSILIVQSICITAAVLKSQSPQGTPLTSSGFAYLLMLIYVAPWFSQNLAALTGIPVYSLLLVALGSFQLRDVFREHS